MFPLLVKRIGKGESGGKALAEKILRWVPGAYHPIVRLVSKEAKELIDEVEPANESDLYWGPVRSCANFAKFGDLNSIIFAYNHGASLQGVCLKACRHGQLHVLEWALYKENTLYSHHWAYAAVKHNHMHVLRYLAEHGLCAGIADQDSCVTLVYEASSPTAVLDFIVEFYKKTPFQLACGILPLDIDEMPKTKGHETTRWFAQRLCGLGFWTTVRSVGWVPFFDSYVSADNYNDYRWFMFVTSAGQQRKWATSVCDAFVELGRTDIMRNCIRSQQCSCGRMDRHKP